MKNFKLTILHTSDIHGYILPHNYANKQEINIGLAKIASLIKKIRTKNTLLIDTGDTVQGSALTYHFSMNQNKVNPISKVYNYLNYDYYVVGNHDFNYGKEYLYNFDKNTEVKALSANIKENSNNVFDSYHIKEFEDGPKVAIIGLTTHYIPNWENPSNIKDITFDNELETLNSLIKEIRQNHEVDLIVVGYHGGFENDIESGSPLPNETGENSGYKMLDTDIDVLLTGHQHRTLFGEHNGVSYTQPGFNGSHLGLVEIEFEYDGRWKIKTNKAKLLENNDLKTDNNISKLIEEYEGDTQKWLDTPIGKLSSGDCLLTDPLLDRLNKNPLVTLINKIQMEVSDTDISCTSLGNSVKGFQSSITLRDIISTYIYPNTLVVLEVKGQDIKDALEKSAEFFILDNNEIKINSKFMSPKLELYNYDMYDGINYTIDLRKNIGERITKIIYKDKPLEMDKDYNVVMNNYRAAGGGNFTMFKNKKEVKTINKDMVEIIADYLLKHKVIELTDENNITIIND